MNRQKGSWNVQREKSMNLSFFPWDLQKEDLKITVLPIQKETVFSRLFWVKESGMHGNKTLRESDPVKRDRFQCHGLLVVSLNT